MIVLDASALANALGDDGPAGVAASTRMTEADAVLMPDLADVEAVSVLRRRWLAGSMSLDRFRASVGQLGDLPIIRFPAAPLMPRAFELRANVTPYDACYVALAEQFNCTLVTFDARLARSPRIRCSVEVLSD